MNGDGVPTVQRRATSAALTVLALVVVLVALTVPDRLEDLAPGVFLRLPVELLGLLAVVLALPDRLARWRGLLALLADDPHVGVLGASRKLGVARGTVQARLDRLTRNGVIRSFAPTLDPSALGYPVSAFCMVEIRQGQGHEQVVEHLHLGGQLAAV